MRRLLPLLAILALTLTGCTGKDADPEPPVDTPTVTETAPSEPSEPSEPDRTDVDWSTLPTNYQRIVDEETTAGNCDALQDMFDTAPQQTDLLKYLDEALTIADCY